MHEPQISATSGNLPREYTRLYIASQMTPCILDLIATSCAYIVKSVINGQDNQVNQSMCVCWEKNMVNEKV